MQISIKSIELNNFRSFKGLHFKDFTKSGLVAINGRYQDNSAISNGSGKTTLLMAINYLHLFNDIPNSELQNWQSEEPFYVKGIYDYDGDILEIKRGSGIYEITYQNKTIFGEDAKKLFEKLFIKPEILERITYRKQQSEGIFIPLTSSERYDLLFQITDLGKIDSIIEESKETVKNKQILVDNINDKIDLNKNKHAWVSAEKAKVENSKDHIKQKISRSEVSLAVLVEPIQSGKDKELLKQEEKLLALKASEPKEDSFFDPLKLEAIKNKIDKIKNESILSVDDAFKVKVYSLKESYEDTKKDLNNLLILEDNLQKEVNEQLELLYVFSAKIKAFNGDPVEIRNLYEQALISLELNKNKLSNIDETSICPSCEQKLHNPSKLKEKILNENKYLEDKLHEFLQNRTEIEELIELINKSKEIEEFLSSRKKLLTDISFKKMNLQNKLSSLEDSINNCYKLCQLEFQNAKDKKQGLLNSLNNELFTVEEGFKTSFLKQKNKWLLNISQLEKDIQDKNKLIEDNFRNELEKYNNLKNKFSIEIDTYKKELDGVQTSLNGFITELDELDKTNKQLNLEKNKLLNEIYLEFEIQNSLGKNGFSKLYLNNTLDMLTETTNNNMASIPILGSFSVVLDSEKVLKNQSSKNDIDLKIYHGSKEVSYRSLSGGQKAALNWAVDLAVQQLIEIKNDKTFNFFFLDEPFAGLDLQNKQESIDMLSKFVKNKLVLVTDHAKLTDQFENEIVIEFADGESKFVA